MRRSDTGEVEAKMSGDKAITPVAISGGGGRADALGRSLSAPPADRTYLPLGIDMAGVSCLVVGGGRIGARKAKTLASHGAAVTVLAPRICDSLADMVSSGKLSWRRGEYASRHLAGFAFVVAATSDPATNIRIGRDAEHRRIPSCVASSGRFSRVIFPARHEQDGVIVAVHSNGRDCARSKRLRDELAAMLDSRHRQSRQTLGVVGVRRGDISAGDFRALTRTVRVVDNDTFPVTDAVVLATCRRWECYFLSSSPRATCRALRTFLRGVFGDGEYPPASCEKFGAKAYHHLLRVLSGLDSPLRGETEIIGQARSAVERRQGSGNTSLDEIFASAMRGQKAIRKEADLAAAVGSWAEAAAQCVTALNCDRALVVGCGKLGNALTGRLVERGLAVTAFSQRSGRGRRNGTDAADHRIAPGAVATERLGNFLGSDSVVILCSQAGGEEARQLARHVRQKGRLTIVDLEGGHDALRLAAGPGRYIGPEDITGRISGRQAFRIAGAEKAALRHALRWQRQRRATAAPSEPIRIIGRPSELSRIQIAEAMGFLESLDPQVAYTVTAQPSPGDRDRSTPLPMVAEDDFFTRDLDEALLEWRADLAVHSAKDIPSVLRDGLCLAAVLPAIAPWDCLVSRDGSTLEQLPAGARVGVSCVRRRDGLASLRADLRPEDVRGNVPDRLRQMDAGQYDALILAAVGLIRLGMQDRICEIFPQSAFPTPPGQGSLAIVIRADDIELRRFLEPLDMGDRSLLP